MPEGIGQSFIIAGVQLFQEGGMKINSRRSPRGPVKYVRPLTPPGKLGSHLASALRGELLKRPEVEGLVAEYDPVVIPASGAVLNGLFDHQVKFPGLGF